LSRLQVWYRSDVGEKRSSTEGKLATQACVTSRGGPCWTRGHEPTDPDDRCCGRRVAHERQAPVEGSARAPRCRSSHHRGLRETRDPSPRHRGAAPPMMTLDEAHAAARAETLAWLAAYAGVAMPSSEGPSASGPSTAERRRVERICRQMGLDDAGIARASASHPWALQRQLARQVHPEIALRRAAAIAPRRAVRRMARAPRRSRRAALPPRSADEPAPAPAPTSRTTATAGAVAS